jgi:hypothetical protein
MQFSTEAKRTHKRSHSPSASTPCRCGGACPACRAKEIPRQQPSLQWSGLSPLDGLNLARLPVHGTAQHADGGPEDETEVRAGGAPGAAAPGATPTQAPASPGNPPTTPATPCPTSVRVGAVVQRNHADQATAERESYRTWLGAMSRMDVGPGPDHSGHCMKERLSVVSNDCPAAVYTRGGQTVEPCTGNKCLDINRYGTSWGVSDGPTAFLDMHRTRAAQSLLEGTNVSSCSVVCEQTYTCDRTHATTGRFHITRNYRAGTYARTDGNTVHITTGTVTKTDAPAAGSGTSPAPGPAPSPPSPQVGPRPR